MISQQSIRLSGRISCVPDAPGILCLLPGPSESRLLVFSISPPAWSAFRKGRRVSQSGQSLSPANGKCLSRQIPPHLQDMDLKNVVLIIKRVEKNFDDP